MAQGDERVVVVGTAGHRPTQSMRRLLLLGGGHAHVHVLRALAETPLPRAAVTLVSPYARQLYSGMVPGLIAGHYTVADCAIELAPLCRAAGVALVQDSAVALDTTARRVCLTNGEAFDYELLSIDTGGVTPVDIVPGAREHAWPVRPIEGLLERWEQRLLRPGPAPSAPVVIGGGAAGVELSMALRHRLGAGAAVTLLAGFSGILPGQPDGLRRKVIRALARCEVQVIDSNCSAIEADAVCLPDETRLACDLAILAVGASAARWLADSGLVCDEQGFVLTGPTLQSRSHPDVFVVGDAATRTDVSRPRSGVYAVRAGPPLADNLRRWMVGDALRNHSPQRRSLALLACGGRHAIASWGRWSIEGDWVWSWKDRIDRGFVERYAQGPASG